MSNDAVVSFQSADATAIGTGAIATSSLNAFSVVVGDEQTYFNNAQNAYAADNTSFCLSVNVASTATAQDKTTK